MTSEAAVTKLMVALGRADGAASRIAAAREAFARADVGEMTLASPATTPAPADRRVTESTPSAPTHCADARRGRGALVLTAGMAFATSSPLGRWARPADPLVVAFGRLAVAAVALVLFDARGIASSVRALTTRQRLTVAAGGALLGAHFACFQWGLEHTSLAAAASLVSLEPVSVVLVAWVLFKLRPTREELIGIGVATLGALLVGSAAGEGEHPRDRRPRRHRGRAALRPLPRRRARRAEDAADAELRRARVRVGGRHGRARAPVVCREHAACVVRSPDARVRRDRAARARADDRRAHGAASGGARAAAVARRQLASPLETVGSIAIGAAVLKRDAVVARDGWLGARARGHDPRSDGEARDVAQVSEAGGRVSQEHASGDHSPSTPARTGFKNAHARPKTSLNVAHSSSSA